MNTEEVSKFLRELRKKNNLTQRQFAKKYGFNYKVVSQWEKGLVLPEEAIIKKIGKDFKVSVKYLFKNKKDKKDNIIIILMIIFTLILIGLGIFLIGNDIR